MRLAVRRIWKKEQENEPDDGGAKPIGGKPRVYSRVSRFDAVDVKPAYSQLSSQGEGGGSSALKYIEDAEDLAYDLFQREKCLRPFLPKYNGVKVKS